MNRLNMQSKNILGENIEFIASRFPNVITETKDENGNLTRKIDFEILMQELSGDIVEGNKERYQLTWPGKKEAILNANTPINKTLRPVIEDSVDFENTENLYIEGDNLEVLKLLQESYLGKIKCIYIDPPYNTGNDFIYKDDFKYNSSEYLEDSGQLDKAGNKLFQNLDSNGRFHSDWLTMMYSRLKLAKNLLTKDGVIFISIDDNEVYNMKKICDEVLGEKNFISNFIWVKKKKGSHLSKTIRSMTEYILAYANKIENIELFGEAAYSDKWQPLAKRTNSHKTLKFNANVLETKLDDGYYEKGNYGEGTSSIKFENDFSVINNIVTTEINATGPFVWTQNKLDEELKLGTRVALSSKFGFNALRSNQADKVKRPTTLLDSKLKIGTNEDAYAEGIRIFEKENIMSYPKPTSLVKYLINTLGYYDNNMTILDFFSGSGSTADSVMQLNALDGGRRKFIMVQLPEETEEKSEAYKEGYKNICEIGKERIRRAGQKIKQETNADIDYGFRVYKVDSTNMKDTYYNIEQITQASLFETQSNIKEDRTPEDLLTQVILDLGLELSLKIEEKNINGKKVFYVDEDSLVACFDEGVDKDLATIIAKDMPMKVVFRDSCFINDSEKENIKEIFKKYSPDTDIKVL